MTAQASFEPRVERSEADPLLVVDLGGFEGPLDLLLDLARRQKVDLHEISIADLAEQYLDFVETAQSMRIELAADYLVMAAWLAYLKSRLLLPEPPRPEEPSAGDLAVALARRLRRLEAVREAAQLLSKRPQLGREVFSRGTRDEMCDRGPRSATASLYDLLSAYARQRQRTAILEVRMGKRPGWSLADARAALERFIGQAADWTDIDSYLARYMAEPGMRPTVLASALSAALEMVREGKATIRQDSPFGPVLMHNAAKVA